MTATTKKKTLVVDLRDKLRDLIRSDQYKPGDRLPSEAQLTAEYGVSRTVVREAIAALRADGLVEPQRGAGVFVIEPKPDPMAPFRDVDTDKLSTMIELLELRTAVEVEAAGLAAQRRSPTQEEKIVNALRELNQLTAEGGINAEADFALHLAIADATNNPRFGEFLRMLGTQVIPRRALDTQTGKLPQEYLDLLQREHDDLVTAILDGDENAARLAMRQHLKGSQTRYRSLLRG